MTRNWLDDFEFRWNGLRVRKTGAFVRFDPGTISSTLAWFRYFFAVQGAFPKRADFTAAFWPERARPWYLIWPVLRLAGARIVSDPRAADLVIHFDDSITAAQPLVGLPGKARTLNMGCGSIAKSAVAAAHEAAFGYPLALDPRVATGPMVEKGEGNGVHDGRYVTGPMEPLPGRVYQRAVDAHGADGFVEDLRTPTLAGRPACVFIKRRPPGLRFSNDNAEVLLARVEDVFSAAEIAGIGRFCAALGLDWGGVDVLRDRRDGRIYVVDANKTDMGPPTALPLADQIAATRLLATAMRDFMDLTAPGRVDREDLAWPPKSRSSGR